MKLTKNIIAFQRNLVVVPNQNIDNRNLAMITQAELMTFGYMLDADALDQLGHADAADIKDFHNEVIDYLKEMTGGLRDYQPIYPGFPEQVMQMSEWELWYNQLIGYWSGGSFVPDKWTAAKKTAFEHVDYKMLYPGTEDDFKNIFTTLASTGNSLTPNDLEVLKWFVLNYDQLEFPEIVPFKENLTTMLGVLIENNRNIKTVKLPKLTTTDVLRVIVFLSGGDVSLPAVPPARLKVRNRFRPAYVENPARDKFKFKKFNRKERKFILALLEQSNLDVREMKLKDQRWIRIGEIIHPGEFQDMFPRAYRAFDRIRNTKVVSWYGEVAKAFDRDLKEGLTKLAERPGEFMRKLDYLIRTYGELNMQLILDTLAPIISKSSNKVLFEVYDHFEKRLFPTTGRKVMIKGARKHTRLKDLPAINSEYVGMIQSTIFDTLKLKFSELPPLGDCWVDEELKKIPLPTNMRSLNDSLVPIIRGQRIPFGEGKKVIRPFIHWYDPTGYLDIDLHGFLMGPATKAVSFGFNGTHRSDFGCYSGDVRHRQGPCAEYVDIVVDKALEQGYNYFLMVAHNFQNGTLADIKECVAGVMEREFPESSRLWKPDTITNCVKLTQAAKYALIAAYDLQTREYIHLDLDFGNLSTYVNSSQATELFEVLKDYIAPPKVSVYDLVMWHVESRGRVVLKEAAGTHFLFDDFKSSYEKTMSLMGI